MWAAVTARFAHQHSYAYLDLLRLGELGRDAVVLHSLPGRRDVLQGVTPRHREELARAFGEVLGRRVRVELTAPPQPRRMRTMNPATPRDRRVGSTSAKRPSYLWWRR